MKILMVSADFPPIRSGEASHTYFMAHHLARAGHDVHILTTRMPKPRTSYPFKVHAVMPSWTWMDLPRFVRFVRQCSPDAVLLVYLGVMYRHHPMITFAPTIVRRLVPLARCVTQFEQLGAYTWTMPTETLLIRKLMSFWASRMHVDYEYGTLLRDSHALVFLAQSHRAQLEDRHPQLPQKSHLIPTPPIVNVCPEQAGMRRQCRAELHVSDEEFILLFFGYIYAGKGIDIALLAMQALIERAYKVRLLVVGGPIQRDKNDDADESRRFYNRMRQHTVDLKLADHVQWLGPIDCDSSRLSQYFFAADACILPFREGVRLNNSSFAACAAHSVPVITTANGDTEDVFRHRVNVILCPPQSPESIVEAVEELMTSPELRQRLSKGVADLAREWYSWDDAMQRILELLGTTEKPLRTDTGRVAGSRSVGVEKFIDHDRLFDRASEG